MLLDRSRPSAHQGFGDYLSDLASKNGFSDVGNFKLFLARSSKRRYRISCSFSSMVRIVSGLFIEIGIDDREDAGIEKPQCFECVNTLPKSWDWKLAAEDRCRKLISYSGLSKLVDLDNRDFQMGRENYCGLIMCSAKRLGLNFSSTSKEGLYYADIFSKQEREQVFISDIYPKPVSFDAS